MGLGTSFIIHNFINEDNEEKDDEKTKKKYKKYKDKTCSDNFLKVIKELKDKNEIKKTIFDENTKLNLVSENIGTKCYDVYGKKINLKQFNNFTDNNEMLLIKFKRKKDSKTISLDEVKKYVNIQNGEVKFIKPVTPEKIYQITKALNREFYLAVNQQDQVIPMSNWHANQIICNNCKMELNENLHISNIYNTYNKKINPQIDNLSNIYIDWFNKTINHHHPYAYSDMVIPNQIKNYHFRKKSSNNKILDIYTQFSNELTQKDFKSVTELRDFVEKINLATINSRINGSAHAFAMPFPLYKKKHMLSIIVFIKPTGQINITIVNANRSPTAKKEYGEEIKNIIQKSFLYYAKDNKSIAKIAKTVKYHFHENNSQYGPTCMTHADCITRQFAKDKDFEKDSHDIHPVKIWEKAYLRGFASNLYKKALEQNKFIPDDIKRIENHHMNNDYMKKNKKINNNKPNFNKKKQQKPISR